jgi:hypothetical protein
MITRFAGHCEVCGGAIPAGEEAYFNVTTKKVSHYGCTPPSGKTDRGRDGARELAGRLGFRPHAELMASDRPLLLLSGAVGGRTAGRTEPAPPEDQGSLFGMSQAAVTEEHLRKAGKVVA